MSILIGFCIILVLCVWVYQDAKKRNEPPLIWAIAVFCLAIVMFPIYLIIRKPISHPLGEHSGVPSQKPSLCSTCGKYYEGLAAYCPLCGASQTSL